MDTGKHSPSPKHDLLFWCIENLREQPGAVLTSTDIEERYGSGKSSKDWKPIMRRISENIQVLFVNVFRKVERKQIKCIRESVITFNGLTLKQQSENDIISFADIASVIPDGFFNLPSHDVSKINIGTCSGYISNGHRVIKEVSFTSSNEWYLKIFGKIVKLDHSNTFSLTRSSISDVLLLVSVIQVCTGCPEHLTEKQTNSKSFMTENWSKTGDENSNCVVLRSKFCKRIKSLHASSCSGCRHISSIPTITGVKPKAKLPQTDTQSLTTNGNESNVIPHNSEANLSDNNSIPLTIDNKRSTDVDYMSHDTPDLQAPQSEDLTVCSDDHDDLSVILQRLLPSASGKTLTFLSQQGKNLEKRPNARRWNKDIVRLCLTMYCKAPKMYNELRTSGFVTLPSGRLLRMYKNIVSQESGLQKEVFHWMRNEAIRQNIPTGGWEGGFLFDEMSIQDDLVLARSGKEMELVGFTDLGTESSVMEMLRFGKRELHLASHVLQFVFLGFTGFRFPIAHFPTEQVKSYDMHFLFWKATRFLNQYGFTVRFTSQDGAQVNREFMHMIFTENCGLFKSPNIIDPTKPDIACIMDYSHVMKRVRNNILKSGTAEDNQRHLGIKNKNILWQFWIDAYIWDTNTNPFPIHHRLSRDHIYLTNESKMRNHLAEEVLDSDMHHLMKAFQKSLPGDGGAALDLAVELLHHTSKLVANFRDRRPITSPDDERLIENRDALGFFTNWEESVQSESISPAQKNKKLISSQTREDIKSLLCGFEFLVSVQLKSNGTHIVPSRINSDAIENIFCQQRGLYNGANTNPTYQSFCKSTNSIILCQSTVSRKSNAFRDSAEPYNFNTSMSLQRQKKQT